MTTVAEKQASVATFIDDLASALAGLSEWENGDTAITNDQSTDGWRDNGRVFTHTPSGRYLLFYASTKDGFNGYEDYKRLSGIRFVYSKDWDSTNNLPKGKSNYTEQDPFSGNSNLDATNRSNSFYYSNHRSYGGAGAWMFSNRMGNSRSDFAENTSTNYFLSARNGNVTIGAWASGSNGSSTYFSYEQTLDKFWSDNIENFCVISKSNASSSYPFGSVSYGFKYSKGGRDTSNDSYVGHPKLNSGLEPSRWGHINSTSNDDTYFVQYGLLYSEMGKKNPSVYTKEILRNDRDQGGAHGDEVSYDGSTYKILKQSGKSKDNPISACLRFE